MEAIFHLVSYNMYKRCTYLESLQYFLVVGSISIIVDSITKIVGCKYGVAFYYIAYLL